MYSRRNHYCTGTTCCIDSTGTAIDALEVECTIPAGNVSVGCDGFQSGCQLAKIYFPTQEYRAGFNPENALCQGTLFPELVRLYK